MKDLDQPLVGQLVFEGLLSPLGYVVTPAMDGEQAMHIVRSREFLPDVILLDVQMPGKTGYEVRGHLVDRLILLCFYVQQLLVIAMTR
jgi:CheY-like chemotaxis protein